MSVVQDVERIKYLAPSVHLVFRLLKILSDSGDGLGVSELSSQAGWPKSSLHDILSTLAHDGFVAQDPERGRYLADGLNGGRQG